MDSVIVFDIRNFSAHRQFLGQRGRAARVAQLIKETLNDAVATSKAASNTIGNRGKHLINYTGDGFVLVLRGKHSPKIAAVVVSKLRRATQSRILAYNNHFKRTYKDSKLSDLSFGVGCHVGQVVTFEFQTFDHGSTKQGEGFVGTTVNVASRVEQCTKDHPYRVLCTKRFRDEVIEEGGKKRQEELESYFVFIGRRILRGFDSTYTLYYMKESIHNVLLSKG